MSKDIRSYFSVQSSKKVTSEPDKVKKKESSSSFGRRKRAVIESDSDEEVAVIETKKSVKASPVKEKVKTDPRPVNAADVFGVDTVQRTNRKRSKNSIEFHNDPDFDKVLEELDESQWADASCSKGSAQHVTSTVPIKTDSFASSNSPSKRDSSLASRSPGKIKRIKLESSESLSENKVKVESPVSLLEEAKDFDRGGCLKESKYPPIKGSSGKAFVSVNGNIKVEVGSEKNRDASVSIKVEKNPERTVESKRRTDAVKAASPPSYMWVDKYKPSTIKQIIGQQGDKSNVRKLLNWLSSWHSNHGPGVNKKLVRPSPWAKDDSGSYFKAALLSGPPGVGKTTTAHLVCKEVGMDVVEFNASDTRSQKLMSKEVSELLSSKSLLPFFQSGGESATSAKHVLVMDEVDGMAGNEDRGGVGELINLIKNSKCPVICMCNDRNHPKIRSLANYCFDLRFHKPRVEQIRGAMMSVCFKEKVQISPQALDEVIAGTNCDIRQVLNNLSMWSSVDKKMNSDQVKTDANAAKKNIKLGPWDAVRKVFSAEDHKTMSLMDKSDVFFHDYNIMPLFVQENYLVVSPHAAEGKSEILHHVAKAASSISYGDLIEKTIRSRNAWSLLPVQSVFSSVVPGDWMEGHFTGQIQFPSWLGKNSRGGKFNRLIQELQMHMRLSISGNKQAVNLNYLEPLVNTIVNPLITSGSEGVPRTLQLMQDYYLTRDDLDSLQELYQWPGRGDPMAKVESKVKAALTRAYNKCGGVMTPYALNVPVKKKKGISSSAEDGAFNEEEDDLEEDDSEDEADAMIKAKKPEKKEPQSKAASSSRGSHGSRGSKPPRGRGRGKGNK